MELRHLRYFVAVAEELSFTKAAAKLRLAQPSLTRVVPHLLRESTIAWRPDNPSKPLKDYIQIVKELSSSV